MSMITMEKTKNALFVSETLENYRNAVVNKLATDNNGDFVITESINNVELAEAHFNVFGTLSLEKFELVFSHYSLEDQQEIRKLLTHLINLKKDLSA
ncbi:hypothetical protein [Priestia aryabhattai]